MFSLSQIDYFKGELKECGRHRYTELTGVILLIESEVAVGEDARFFVSRTEFVSQDFEKDGFYPASPQVWLFKIVSVIGRGNVNEVS